jgi:hypothetical protein
MLLSSATPKPPGVPSVYEKLSLTDDQSHTKSMGRRKTILGKVLHRPSKGERDFWNEVIDEIQLLPLPDSRPLYSAIYPSPKTCCKLIRQGDGACSECSCSSIHSWASSGAHPLSYLGLGDINHVDQFGNTPLHYAAGSGKSTVNFLLTLIKVAPI